MKSKTAERSCECCSPKNPKDGSYEGLNRREFLTTAGTAALASFFIPSLKLAEATGTPEKDRIAPIRFALRVQPVLLCESSERIVKDLDSLKASADFPVEFLPVAMVNSADQASRCANGDHDVMLQFATGNHGEVLKNLTNSEKWNVRVLRHDAGNVESARTGMDACDVVEDNLQEVLWRLRSLHALKNTLNKKIVAVGGAGGWASARPTAPDRAREVWKLNIEDLPYSDLGERIKAARTDADILKRCREDSEDYLRRGVSLQTTEDFVINAFLLREVLIGILDENGTDALTINSCMNTVMSTAETTACLALSLLNDDGYMAFCESDFVVIPSGILLHYIGGKPVFLNDPTYPHDGSVTLAHCTAPRRMDGRRLEKAKILTHFESDYGAAPKVEMKLGQVVTNIVPDFASKKWVGFSGSITANPFMDICRTQIDVRINGDWKRLLEDMQGFHWMTCYGDYLNEIGYALKKVGIEWKDISGGSPQTV